MMILSIHPENLNFPVNLIKRNFELIYLFTFHTLTFLPQKKALTENFALCFYVFPLKS